MEIFHETTSVGASSPGTGGYCKRCHREHWLGPGNTSDFCKKLMQKLDNLGTIDLFSTQRDSSPLLKTDSLFGPARGKMFGVMECLTADDTSVILYAFSGQYNGAWLVDGWVPPLFEVDDFLNLTAEKEKQIKALGKTIDRCPQHSDVWLAQRKTRRRLSRKLMSEIHKLYLLSNFRGTTAGLDEAFIGEGGIPSGTGDCCAPKLLHYAIRNNLRPLGISEFFWGKENRRGGHKHGVFAGPCAEKCRPILGFMLCGLQD